MTQSKTFQSRIIGTFEFYNKLLPPYLWEDDLVNQPCTILTRNEIVSASISHLQLHTADNNQKQQKNYVRKLLETAYG